MTPQKAIIIILIIFLIIVAVFAFLYLEKQSAVPAGQPVNFQAGTGKNILPGLSDREKLSPVQKKNKAIEDKAKQQVERIIEQGRTAAGGLTAEARKKIEEAVNQEIAEKMKLKTKE